MSALMTASLQMFSDLKVLVVSMHEIECTEPMLAPFIYSFLLSYGKKIIVSWLKAVKSSDSTLLLLLYL